MNIILYKVELERTHQNTKTNKWFYPLEKPLSQDCDGVSDAPALKRSNMILLNVVVTEILVTLV